MAPSLAFWAALTFMAGHEVDAIRRHEWRILPMTSFLPDAVGRQVFIWSHVPLGVLAIWLLSQGAPSKPALIFSAFSVIHVALHIAFRRHPENEFAGVISWGLIAGSGVFGAVHLALVGL